MGRGDDKIARQQNQANAAAGTALTAQGAAGANAGITDFVNQVHQGIDTNPYEDPRYLSNVRSTASAVESGAQNAGNTKLEDVAHRSGENTSSIVGAEEEGARESARRQHDVLTRSALDDQTKRQQQLETYRAMLGQVPGMYSPQIGAGTSLATGAASNQTQMAGQGSWFDNLINAGIAAGGAAAGEICPAKGSMILMYDGTRKPVETLQIGDFLKSADGGREVLLSTPIPALQLIYHVICDSGSFTKASGSHAIMRASLGYVPALNAIDQFVRTEEEIGFAKVRSVLPLSEGEVYPLRLDRTRTYLADGIWALSD